MSNRDIPEKRFEFLWRTAAFGVLLILVLGYFMDYNPYGILALVLTFTAVGVGFDQINLMLDNYEDE